MLSNETIDKWVIESDPHKTGGYDIHAVVRRAYQAGAEAEREECAKVCEKIAHEAYGMIEDSTARECAEAIRER